MTKLTIYLEWDGREDGLPGRVEVEAEEWIACPGHLYYATKEKRVLIPWHLIRRVEEDRRENR